MWEVSSDLTDMVLFGHCDCQNNLCTVVRSIHQSNLKDLEPDTLEVLSQSDVKSSVEYVVQQMLHSHPRFSAIHAASTPQY